jgi:hypothetical protein
MRTLPSTLPNDQLESALNDIQGRLATVESLLMRLLQSLPNADSDSLRPDRPGHLPLTTPGQFEFDEFEQPPVVNGYTKPLLTQAEYDILMALKQAGPRGLSLEDLDRQSGHPEARKYLKKLAKDRDWQSVIVFPDHFKRGGYRLRFS